MTLQPIF